MTIVSITKDSSSDFEFPVYKIIFSDGLLLSVKVLYLPQVPASFLAGGELSTEEESLLYFAASCYKAEQEAVRLIARAEQSTYGLSTKLEQRHHSTACVRAVVKHLAGRGLVDDSRYARLWIRARLAQKIESPRHVLLALCNRRIDQGIARTALKSELDFDKELALLKKIIQKNCFTPDRNTLKYEGFSSDVLNSYFE